MHVSLSQQRTLQDVHGVFIWKTLVHVFLLANKSTVAQLLSELGSHF